MSHRMAALSALSLLVSTSAVAAPPPTLAGIADEALEKDELAWDFVEGITTEVGPRQAGTEAEARGRAWAVDWLKANGFARIAIEPDRKSVV